jgi:hypothetical protein
MKDKKQEAEKEAKLEVLALRFVLCNGRGL